MSQQTRRSSDQSIWQGTLCTLRQWHPYRRAQLAHHVLCAAGIGVSMYALYVEVNKAHQPDYKPLCDLAEHISCSRVLTSPYSRGFGLLGRLFGDDSPLNLSNCALGIVFYMILFCLGFLHQPSVLLLTVSLSLLANAMSLYLSAVLFFVLEDFCIVCVTIYAINGGLLVASAFRYVRSPKRAKERAFRSSLKKYN